MVCSSLEKALHIFFLVLYEQMSYLRKRLRSFDRQTTAKSRDNAPLRTVPTNTEVFLRGL